MNNDHLDMFTEVASWHCSALVANVTVHRISTTTHRKEQKFRKQDFDTLKRKALGSLLPEDILKNVVFIKYVSKTACLPSPENGCVEPP